MSARTWRVAVLYNAPTLPIDHPDSSSEADVVEVAGQVVESLIRQGSEAWLVPAARPLAGLIDRLSDRVPDLVFNLVEGFGGDSLGEAYLTGLLELLGLPYTGCPPDAQALCHSKARTKALLRGSGLPTAGFEVVRSNQPGSTWDGPWPVIVKPEAEDASLGIDQRSVVESVEGLAPAVERLRARGFGDILIETYLPGPEFNVGVFALPDPEALPVAEIVYRVSEGSWPILTYDAKWLIGSSQDQASRPRCPAEIEESLAERLSRMAVGAFLATGCRDYARVDFRLDSEGNPMILEVNPNPDIGPSAGWARAVRASGRDYDQTIARLASQAGERGASHARG